MAIFRKPRFQAPRKAAADLSAMIYHAVKLNGNGDVILAGVGDEDICYGFLHNDPKAGDICEVATVGGGAGAKLSGTATVGGGLSIAANGTLLPAGSSSKAIGRSWSAGVTGDVVEAEIQLFTTD